MKIHFSDYFDVSPEDIKKYDIYDISLIADNQEFIDPMLLFAVNDNEMNKAHQEMVKYLAYLYIKSKSISEQDYHLLKDHLFLFSEVKQNWLGYTVYGNSGHGLGPDFADDLYYTLKEKVLKFDKDSHPEYVFIFKPGRSYDSISDFTVCLTKKYLLNYTEKIAKELIAPEKCGWVDIQKVQFNYSKEIWESKKYYLPKFQDDFILLTPASILQKLKIHINYNDFIERFVYTIDNLPDALRYRINEHFAEQIAGYVTSLKYEKEDIVKKITEKFPEVILHYIDLRVDSANEAIDNNKETLRKISQLNKNTREIIRNLEGKDFYSKKNRGNIRNRLLILKDFFETNLELSLIYGTLKADEVRFVMSNIWFNEKPKDINTSDKIEVDFFITKNSPVENVLSNKFPNLKYTKHLCYLCFTEKQSEKVYQALNKLKLTKNNRIVVIDVFKPIELNK